MGEMTLVNLEMLPGAVPSFPILSNMLLSVIVLHAVTKPEHWITSFARVTRIYPVQLGSSKVATYCDMLQNVASHSPSIPLGSADFISVFISS